jgi:hypothetical protein
MINGLMCLNLSIINMTFFMIGDDDVIVVAAAVVGTVFYIVSVSFVVNYM